MMLKASISAALAMGALFFAHADTPSVLAHSSQSNDVVTRVESNLLPPILWKGEPRRGMALAGRLSHYQVPSLSLGRLGLDDPVNARLKSWKLPDSAAGGSQAVTVRHLLTHTAGLNPVVYLGVEPTGRIPTALELLQGMGQPPVPAVIRVEPSGMRFSYSNPGYLVLQQLLVDVTGRPFNELAEGEMFAPLGLATSTSTSGRRSLHAPRRS